MMANPDAVFKSIDTFEQFELVASQLDPTSKAFVHLCDEFPEFQQQLFDND